MATGLRLALVMETATEINNSHFDIEWSTDAFSFKKIGAVQGVGTTDEIQVYNFIHKNPTNGKNYYRLKQIDMDGTVEYSKIIQISSKFGPFFKR